MNKQGLFKVFFVGFLMFAGILLLKNESLAFSGALETTPLLFNQGEAQNVTVTGEFWAEADETPCANGVEQPNGAIAIAQKMNRDIADLRYDLRKYEITGYNQDGSPIVDNSSFTVITGTDLFSGSDYRNIDDGKSIFCTDDPYQGIGAFLQRTFRFRNWQDGSDGFQISTSNLGEGRYEIVFSGRETTNPPSPEGGISTGADTYFANAGGSSSSTFTITAPQAGTVCVISKDQNGNPFNTSWWTTTAPANGGFSSGPAPSACYTNKPTGAYSIDATNFSNYTKSISPGSANLSNGNTITFNIIYTPAPTATISANPNPIDYNTASTVTWSSTNTTSCTINGASYPTSGSDTTGPLVNNATYTLTCQGLDGSAVNASVLVTVRAPTVSISTNPTSVAYGGSSTISWTSTNAGSCTKSGDWSGSTTPNVSGSQSTGALNQVKTYTYTLTCSGNGSDTQSAQVTVTAPPPTTSNITITEPDYCVSGSAVTVGWSYSDLAGSPQSAYQVQITDTGNFNNPVLDTGKIISGSSAYFTGQGVLEFNTTYKARVRTWSGYDAISGWANSYTTCNGPGCGGGGSGSWKTPSYAYPQVDFSWTANGVQNNPSPPLNKLVQFTDTTVFNGNSNGREWSWTFGDGGSSTTQNPSHTYVTEGSYYVTLTATDNADQTCIKTKGPLIIQKPIPKWREIAPK
ncbi:MAG: hypothetical protein A2915_04020 [Candidatus Yanofskybacteria bacterium RIFCSPLOWO2_01_FULL_41_34]|uniref:PKD domain-containing protein n=1 Tax=Candidatus Yanofskybacteria bacterium RIFCSPHIGHO2_01_FULL_41_26 TaxID=1802661 RepID=A0A1F8EE55_9BACT|nr:MAG: hypothetical protein A2649_03115 [Candidatus Yanofskybacteria bacterium RIFCSPHIGHO2_01_FULL_41_26]OGN21576.1 MAG: hypothetical protein A2915_04020 [Candidatus Yanofskybacteria bacterium RIFCSPLOWO2_01_FULL_41_34]